MGPSPQQSGSQSFRHAILLVRGDHDVRKSVPGLCPQDNPILKVYCREWHRKDVPCNKEASYKRSAKLVRTFGNSDGESQVPMANVNIGGWLSVALTNLRMNQQHVEGLLVSILTSTSGTRGSRVSHSRYQSWQSTIGNGSSNPILFGRPTPRS